jgi:aromatic ring hydroxylase
MTPGLLKSSHKLQKLYRKSIGCSNTSADYIKYIKYRNKYNLIKRNAKKDYLKNKFSQYKNNSKKCWSLMNQLIGKVKHKHDIPT